jgi:hypothetical protein
MVPKMFWCVNYIWIGPTKILLINYVWYYERCIIWIHMCDTAKYEKYDSHNSCNIGWGIKVNMCSYAYLFRLISETTNKSKAIFCIYLAIEIVQVSKQNFL